MSGQREATDELRDAIHFVQTHEYGAIYVIAILAEAVERALDLCDQWDALRNEAANYYSDRVRAALLGES